MKKYVVCLMLSYINPKFNNKFYSSRLGSAKTSYTCCDYVADSSPALKQSSYIGWLFQAKYHILCSTPYICISPLSSLVLFAKYVTFFTISLIPPYKLYSEFEQSAASGPLKMEVPFANPCTKRETPAAVSSSSTPLSLNEFMLSLRRSTFFMLVVFMEATICVRRVAQQLAGPSKLAVSTGSKMRRVLIIRPTSSYMSILLLSAQYQMIFQQEIISFADPPSKFWKKAKINIVVLPNNGNFSRLYQQKLWTAARQNHESLMKSWNKFVLKKYLGGSPSVQAIISALKVMRSVQNQENILLAQLVPFFMQLLGSRPETRAFFQASASASSAKTGFVSKQPIWAYETRAMIAKNRTYKKDILIQLYLNQRQPNSLMAFPISIHCYDLSQGMAKNLSMALVGKQFEGIWHTGIVVYGKEYYFGGGISYDPPGRTPFGNPTRTVEIGFTEIPEEMFMEFLKEVSDRFSFNTYNVFKHNCNHFTNECAEFLLGEGIPGEYVNQGEEFLRTPMGKMFAPMMESFQDGLRVNSHQLFNEGGEQQAIHQEGAQPVSTGGMPEIPGMGGLGGFPGMGGGMPRQQRPPPQSNGPSKVIQIQSQQQLTQIIKDTPAVIIDFWSPRCPPCMNIKPSYEGLAQANDNENLVLVAVNTMEQPAISQSFGVKGIPDFRAFLNGNQYTNFTGANLPRLNSLVAELEEQVQSGAANHKKIDFKEFKPGFNKPMTYDQLTNIDKMKELVTQFISKEETKKEVKSTENILKWAEQFKVEAMPKEAIDELMELIEVAEDKNKIALCDLLRLVLLQEHSAAFVVNRHWEKIEVSVIGYLQCFDPKDQEDKLHQNYHMLAMKVLANIFATNSGKDYIQSKEVAEQIISICTFSFDSINPKVVQYAAIVLFNVFLCFKRSLDLLDLSGQEALKKIVQIVPNGGDKDTVMALLLCECRMLYGNRGLTKFAMESLGSVIKENHSGVSGHGDAAVRRAVEDVYSLIG